MKIKLTIEAHREGYSLNQCGDTLTTSDLIEILEQYPEDTPIYVSNDNGYTYGSISENDISEKEDDDDE